MAWPLIIQGFLPKETKTNYIDLIGSQIELETLYVAEEAKAIAKSHKLRKEDVINLCGGLPSPATTNAYLTMEAPSSKSIKVKLDTNLYCSTRIIDFENLTITNEKFVFNKPGQTRKGTGRMMLVNQIKAANKVSLNKILVYAKGGRHIQPPDKWNGHYTWARLGFTMDSDFCPVYDEFMLDTDYSGINLNELMKTPEGRKFWENNGRPWPGFFELNKNSDNMKIFKAYLKERNTLVYF